MIAFIQAPAAGPHDGFAGNGDGPGSPADNCAPHSTRAPLPAEKRAGALGQAMVQASGFLPAATSTTRSSRLFAIGCMSAVLFKSVPHSVTTTDPVLMKTVAL